MRSRLSAFLSVAALACLASVAGAQAKQATVTCNDGTTSTATGRGACSSHGGVKKAAASKGETKAATPAGKPKTAETKPAKAADTSKPKTAGKPAAKTATVKCTDGTMSKGGQGACSSHGGIAKPK
ncbi:MAG TPA: hypothetical protein VGQ44_18570 [Gemmatimonadaceae bacterium]|jgi:hypothetical protein|nr:hypothetical protein [Gemmatimonadaceae bacterium]